MSDSIKGSGSSTPPINPTPSTPEVPESPAPKTPVPAAPDSLESSPPTSTPATTPGPELPTPTQVGVSPSAPSSISQNAALVFREMEKDYQQEVIRPWMPTSIPDKKVPGSLFSQWATKAGEPAELQNSEMSASCFEIFLLFAARAEVLSPTQVQNVFEDIDRRTTRVPGFKKAATWFRSWLGKLSGGKSHRSAYVRAKRPDYAADVDWGVELHVDDKGKRVFPKQGDIIFFNPINHRPNGHFDHVALATGRQITRRELTGNEADDDTHLEAEILSFYGRGPRRDTHIEKTTIEHMLDTHSLIKRTPPEGGDRQVFFSPPPWARERFMKKIADH